MPKILVYIAFVWLCYVLLTIMIEAFVFFIEVGATKSDVRAVVGGLVGLGAYFAFFTVWLWS